MGMDGHAGFNLKGKNFTVCFQNKIDFLAAMCSPKIKPCLLTMIKKSFD